MPAPRWILAKSRGRSPPLTACLTLLAACRASALHAAKQMADAVWLKANITKKLLNVERDGASYQYAARFVDLDRQTPMALPYGLREL